MKTSDKIRDRITELKARGHETIATAKRVSLTWVLELIEAQDTEHAQEVADLQSYIEAKLEANEWTLCTVTPVPRTVVSETRPAWIEVWSVDSEHPRGPKGEPGHLEPIGPFAGNEWRYYPLVTPFAWRFVVPPEAGGGGL